MEEKFKILSLESDMYEKSIEDEILLEEYQTIRNEIRKLRGTTSLHLGSISETLTYPKELAAANVEHLSLSGVTGNQLCALRKASWLRNLAIYNPKPEVNWSCLKGNMQLKTLQLDGGSGSNNFNFSEFSTLEKLYLNSVELSKFNNWKSLKNLTSLEINGYTSGETDFLKDLPNLDKFSMYFASYLDISPLSGHENLQYLALVETSLGNLDFLERNQNLSTLSLLGSRSWDNSFLKHLTSLTGLEISGIREEDLSYVREMKLLNRLFLDDIDTTDSSYLETLEGMDLQILSISNSTIEDLRPLRNIDFETLHLRGSNMPNLDFLITTPRNFNLNIIDATIYDTTGLGKLIRKFENSNHYLYLPDGTKVGGN